MKTVNTVDPSLNAIHIDLTEEENQDEKVQWGGESSSTDSSDNDDFEHKKTNVPKRRTPKRPKRVIDSQDLEDTEQDLEEVECPLELLCRNEWCYVGGAAT